MLVITLGFSQFGLGATSWSNLEPAFAVKFGWDKSDTIFWGDLSTSVLILGAMIGALLMAKLVHKHGKLRILVVTNMLMILGVSICLTGSITAIIFGRFIWGFCFGVFSVVCSKYVNEICPVELKGTFGALNQTMLVAGSTVPSGLSLYYPRVIDQTMKDDFIVTQYWRVIWLAPILISLMQLFFLRFCFYHETPIYLKSCKREAELRQVLDFFYTPAEAERRYIDLSKSDELSNS